MYGSCFPSEFLLGKKSWRKRNSVLDTEGTKDERVASLFDRLRVEDCQKLTRHSMTDFNQGFE